MLSRYGQRTQEGGVRGVVVCNLRTGRVWVKPADQHVDLAEVDEIRYCRMGR